MSVRVFLVDDSLTFMAAVRRFLEALPGVLIVGESNDGEEALKSIRNALPDLVLLDMAMPGVGGLEVARNLQLISPPPRVVFLSMHEAACYDAIAKEVGATNYIHKPDFVVQLLPIIEKMIAEDAVH